MLRSLWNYRHFILASIKGEFRGRYARSRLGAAWFILNPLAQALIFSMVLGQVLAARLPETQITGAFPIYLLAGTAAWGLFSEILNRSVSIFIEQASVLKKIAFPRLCLPVIVWGSALLNHTVLLVAITLIFAVFFSHFPGRTIVLLPIGAILISLLAFGLGMFLGIINVFSRDIGQAMGVVMQLWFWFTPIVYPRSILPEGLALLVDLNPMSHLVGLYQDALLFDRAPDLVNLVYPLLLGVVTVLFSFAVFRRASSEMVDAL